jgi:hypothetical protein
MPRHARRLVGIELVLSSYRKVSIRADHELHACSDFHQGKNFFCKHTLNKPRFDLSTELTTVYVGNSAMRSRRDDELAEYAESRGYLGSIVGRWFFSGLMIVRSGGILIGKRRVEILVVRCRHGFV